MPPQRFRFTHKSHLTLQHYLDASQNDPILTTELEFATRWAGLLEQRMRSHSEGLKTSAATLGLEANPELLSEAMLDRSVAILIEIWEDGEKLAQWYKSSAGQEFRKIATAHPVHTLVPDPVPDASVPSEGA